ncbi:MAG: calcium/sodium antiporter [Calditrichaceae bacterium]|nr:calcium/sodium antiporter [Calditrichaceae bacterium]
MEYFIDGLIILAGITALWGGAVWVVDSASSIAGRLGISEIVIGLTVVAFGTSAPEFAVTLLAAIRNQADISVGNIVGSNIFNLGFILGGVAMVKAIHTSGKLVFRDGAILFISSIMLVYFLYDNTLSLMEGIVLFISLFIYLFLLFIKKETLDDEIETYPFRWYEIPKLIAGLAAIIGGGYFLVDSASHLARVIGLSEWVIGVTIVAAGTSAPEFATSLVAIVKKKHGISAGNLVGSNIFNLLGVLGLAAIIRPMSVDSEAFISILMLTGLTVIVLFLMRTGWRISRQEGIILVIINLMVYLITIY